MGCSGAAANQTESADGKRCGIKQNKKKNNLTPTVTQFFSPFGLALGPYYFGAAFYLATLLHAFITHFCNLLCQLTSDEIKILDIIYVGYC